MTTRLVALLMTVGIVSSCGTNQAVQRDETPPNTQLQSPPLPTLNSSDFQKRFIEVAQVTAKSVVAITSVSVVDMSEGSGHFGSPFERFFFHGFPTPPQRKQKRQGIGSGVIVDGRGYILTNNHVVKDADELQVILQDERKVEAKVVGTDERTDIAVVKIEADNLTPIALGDSEQLQVGEWVMAIGSPFGLNQTVSAGIVSAVGRGNVGIADYEDFIQTDAAINPGNSGGPLVNLAGQLVGINTAIASRSGGSMGIGFAIPIAMAKSVMEQLISGGSVTRGYLGVYIADLSAELAESFQYKGEGGVLIQDVGKDGPGQQAGLKPGDIITTLNDKPAGDASDFRNRIAQTAPGSKVKLGIFRDGKKVEVEVTLGTLPEKEGEVHAAQGAETPKIGVELADITEAMRERFELGDARGALVTGVTPDSPADDAGLKPGDVINQVGNTEVNSAAQANAALAKADLKQPLRLRIIRQGHGLYVILPASKKP